MYDSNERATAAIEKTRLEGSTTLSLNACGLSEIPSEVFELTQLRTLNLYSNSVRVVPERIRELPNLRRLILKHNPVESLPNVPVLDLDWTTFLRCREGLSLENIMGIGITIGDSQAEVVEIPQSSELVTQLLKLPNLRYLSVGLTSITHTLPLGIPKPSGALADLIERIGEFAGLEALSFFGVSLGVFPDGIRKLNRLEELSLYGVGIFAVPDWISELSKLSSFSLGMAALTGLPDALGALALERLGLSNNRFPEVPRVVFNIKSLTHLDLSCHRSAGYTGRIEEIPAEILKLENLKTFDVEGHSFETPPPEVVEKGVEAIKNYWRQQQEVGTDYLCEAKLLIVGEAGAGKTSLAKKIVNS